MDQHEDFFDLRINEDGKRTLLKIHTTNKILLVISLLVQGALLAYAIKDIIRYSDLAELLPPEYYWHVRISLIYAGLGVCFGISGVILFLKFSSKARRAVQLNESTLLNRSLPWINYGLKLAVVGTIITGLYVSYLFIWRL